MSTAIDADQVLATLRLESAMHRRGNLMFRAFCLALLAFMVLATILGHVEWSSLLTVTGIAGASLAAGSRYKSAATSAALFRDPRALPYLVEFLDCEDDTMQSVAEAAVKEILHDVDEVTFASLDTLQRDKLAKALLKTKDLEFAAAILGAAKRSAGSEWIRPLEQFSERKSSMRQRDRERAESLAKMALADIRMRAAKHQIEAKLGEVGAPLNEYTSAVLGEPPGEEHLRADA